MEPCTIWHAYIFVNSNGQKRHKHRKVFWRAYVANLLCKLSVPQLWNDYLPFHPSSADVWPRKRRNSLTKWRLEKLHLEVPITIEEKDSSGPQTGKSTNRQSLAFSEPSQLSQAIPQSMWNKCCTHARQSRDSNLSATKDHSLRIYPNPMVWPLPRP